MPIKHLAIILDGNRRWAKEQGLPAFEGHRRGYENLKDIGLACLQRGIDQLTVFAFSTENWKRGQEEVGFLMGLLLNALTKELDYYMKHNVRLRIVGSRDGLSEALVKAIDEAETKTSGNARGQINICVNYGGRAELVDAVKRIVASGVPAEGITEELVSANVWMNGIPDPDLILRTSGEQRLSGFLTWSGVYSELMFVDTYWPAFTVEHLDAAIVEFASRERRFGK